MTFLQLCSEMLQTSRERVKTPLIGAFITSFIFYNWKAFAELLLSNLAVEVRICIIEQKHSGYDKILIPILIALFYVLILPRINNKINSFLKKTKKSSIENIYLNKSLVLNEKLKIVKKELEYKNLFSENKIIEDYVKEINDLKESRDILITSHRAKLDEITFGMKELKEAHDFFKNESEELKIEIDNVKNNHSDILQVINIFLNLNIFDINDLNEVIKTGKIPGFKDTEKKFATLLRYKLVEFQNGNLVATDLGKKCLDYFKISGKIT